MTTVLDWAEKAGIESLKEHVNNRDLILKETNALLTLLLSGAGAALYFGMQHGEIRLAAIVVSFWLFGVAAILSLKCLMFGDYPAVWNEPKNLNQKNYELDQLREYELENLQTRIRDARTLNITKSAWRNKCIFATCSTPVIGVIAWLF